MQCVQIKDFMVGKGHSLVIFSGPCVIESEAHTLKAAEELKNIFSATGIHLVFKCSFDKANRTAVHGFRGPGLEEGLRILEKVKKEFELPILTDIHLPEQATSAAEVCDILQIPAFLCRQTDLVVAVANTGLPVNVKKGQFMSPWEMKNVVDKIRGTGNQQVILTDRGATFGYNNLVADMRAIPIMQGFGVPVCFDATHSVQLPGSAGGYTGGQREFVPILSRAAIAAGANCMFIEAHPDPVNAKSDAASVMDFKDLPKLLRELEQIYLVVQQL